MYYGLISTPEQKLLRAAFEAGATAALEGERPGRREDREPWVEDQWGRWLAQQGELQPMEDLDLPVRAYNALRREGCRTVGDVRWMVTRQVFDRATGEPRPAKDGEAGETPMYELRNVGYKTVQATEDALYTWHRHRHRHQNRH